VDDLQQVQNNKQTAETAAENIGQAPTATPTPPTRPTVVYIEDDTPSRVLVQVLLSQDFNIYTAANGLEGLNLIRRHKPDIVLTDINLPDLNGDMLAARIRDIADTEIPIVAVTSDNSRETKNRAIAAGCTGFLTKPIEASSLVSTVREYLQGKIDRISSVDRKRATDSLRVAMTAQLEDVQRKLQEDNAMLRNLDKVKTSFLTQVSHELRTPLTVCSGYVQMLNAMLTVGQPVDDTHKELAQKAIEGIKRIHTLMNEILTMARVASDQFEVNAAQMRFDEVAMPAIQEYAEPMSARNLTLNKEGEAWNTKLLADANLIRIVVSNLVSNAIKATPNGGSITVRAALKEPNSFHFVVSDSGVGIDPNDLIILFKPFFTTIDVSRGKTSKTDFMGMGMGMGLTISTRIVNAHKGQIWAESAGHDTRKLPGSQFHVLLPISGRA
jgi:signal transduction histidine kinase